MKQNLSDWMEDIWDDEALESIDLEDPHITTPDRIYALATGAAVPKPTEGKKPHHRHRVWRTALVAAALVTALSATAVAVYQHRVEDAFFPAITVEETETTSQPDLYQWADGTEVVRMSLMGFQDSPEYQAQVAWETYLAQWEEENPDWFYQNGVDDSYFETPENEAYFYGAYAQEQGQALEEIAQEYGLSLHTAWMFFDSAQQLYDLLGVDTPLLEETVYTDSNGGYIYDDGSFTANGIVTTAQGMVGYDLVSAVHGSFTRITNGLETVYDSWDYTTADGVEVVLVLSESQGKILADLDDTFLTMTYKNSYYREGELVTGATLTREWLEELADGLQVSQFQGLYTAERKAALSEQVQTAYAQERAQIEEERSQLPFANMAEKVAAVQALLGEYHISIPGYELRYTNAYHPDADGWTPPMESGQDFQQNYEVYDAYIWEEHPKDELGAMITLRYQRLYDGEGTQSTTAQNFVTDKQLAVEYQELTGDEIRDCTVLGYDGYISYRESENGQVAIRVNWLDTDRDLIFTISYESGGLEGETILTIDDVIALADTLECVE
jgi:hypothetical protein